MRPFLDEQLVVPAPTDVVCSVPLNPFAASAISAASALGFGLLGARFGKAHKHPMAGAMAGVIVGGAVAGPVVANALSSKKTAAETQSLPPIDDHGFMTSEPDVCVLPVDPGKALLFGGGSVVVPGLIGALIGGPTGAVVGATIVSAIVGPVIARMPFSERTASDFR